MDDSLISRRRFLEGCAATLSVTLVGCASQAPGTPQAVASGAGFSIADAPAVAPGEAVAFEFPGNVAGLLFHTRSGEMGAVNAICTHAGCIVNWSGTDPRSAFVCPCHGSQFGPRGNVVRAPATKPLPFYSVKLEGKTAVLTPA